MNRTTIEVEAADGNELEVEYFEAAGPKDTRELDLSIDVGEGPWRANLADPTERARVHELLGVLARACDRGAVLEQQNKALNLSDVQPRAFDASVESQD